MIIIYVDGEQILAPADCIYVPYFEKEEVDALEFRNEDMAEE